MTKTKVFLGVLAAAGAVITGVLMKKRGQIKVEGELEANANKGMGTGGSNRTVKGQATVRTNATPTNRPL
jgi:hypothetical protein